ncbi:DUF7059 domain-containing protein [Nocardioides jejuensis]|uniref:Class I SAM-dependent methyltransferase n=1 Tax=Nocardioides jejuensis TaxID=2502782 RepID=A0A4V2NZP8_9ACTN|nr:class I SAM-dependent methyltransferase [Nocardioides jejuensis]TCJ29902.1 class I SAM-dependent methyltransferase [Nocardioides jejuensis]
MTDRSPLASPLPVALRDALAAADYTYDGVAGLLGPIAHNALSRNETAPGLRRTTGGTPLETLTRLFLLQATVPVDEAEKALPDLVDRLCVEGILERSLSEVAARIDVRPYGAHLDEDSDRDFWVVSDLTPGLDGTPNKVGANHVLGISSASTSLAQLTLRHPVQAALDLGTGCGVQALHLAGHADRVVATDVNKRALWIAEFNAVLNETPNVQVLDGSFFEPVAGDTFDLIATNPPFVISPATGERLVYRDSGLPGDRVVEDIVRKAPELLNDGGWCQILANWVIREDTPWDERLASWLDGSCDAFIVQREVLDPASYVELWLKDAGLQSATDYLHRYDTWLAWFEQQGIEAVGFGWINLRKRPAAATGEPTYRLEEWPYDVEQPIAPAIGAWGEAVDALSTLEGDALFAARLQTREDVQQETLGAPGAEDPHTVVLRQQRGFRRARKADTVEAALVGACDGELSVGQILDALAQLLEADPAETRAGYAEKVRELVAEGFLELA